MHKLAISFVMAGSLAFPTIYAAENNAVMSPNAVESSEGTMVVPGCDKKREKPQKRKYKRASKNKEEVKPQ